MSSPASTAPARDPRDYQIAALALFLFWGVTRIGFEVGPAQIAVTLGSAQLAQWACARAWRVPPPAPVFGVALPWDPKSALISSLSLCLLLRTNHLALAALASALAVTSKFLVRVRGKHVFNPANGALALLLALRAPVWVSPGQWGQTALVGFAVACAGAVVVTRAARWDVTFAFLAAWCVVLFGRAAWLGQPWAAPLHQLSNGALMLFAFFMISDPRTTPDSRAGRLVFAVLVALGTGLVQFVLYRTNGLLWSLATFSLLVPLIDRVLPGSRYQWSAVTNGALPKGASHEGPRLAVRPAAAGVRARA